MMVGVTVEEAVGVEDIVEDGVGEEVGEAVGDTEEVGEEDWRMGVPLEQLKKGGHGTHATCLTA